MRICATCQYLIMLPSYPPKYKCELYKETVDYHHKCDLDIVPVVRCKNCTWWDRNTFECEKAYEYMTGDIEGVRYETWHDHFCADGKRREE